MGKCSTAPVIHAGVHVVGISKNAKRVTINGPSQPSSCAVEKLVKATREQKVNL